MEKSIFESIPETLVYSILGWVSVATLVLGIVAGAIAGAIRKNFARCVLLGVLAGLAGPLVYLCWAVVDARTSYYDRLYKARDPASQRILWRLFPPADYYEYLLAVKEPKLREIPSFHSYYLKYSKPGAIRWWWRYVPPDRLESAPNLLLLLVLYIVGGFAVGLVLGWAKRVIDRRFPAAGPP